MSLVRFECISHRYALGTHAVQALDDVSLDIEAGEFIALAGPSGSGKSTLLNVMGLLERPSTGVLKLEGKDVSTLSERERTRLRRHRLGFVFQAFNLIPVLTAEENVEYFLLKRGAPRREVRDRVEAALAAVGLSDHAHHRPDELSGGQRQRVAIARALVREPTLVLADEPTAALDHATGAAVIELMQRLNADRKVTFVFSTHDPKVIQAARRVVRLEDGRLA